MTSISELPRDHTTLTAPTTGELINRAVTALATATAAGYAVRLHLFALLTALFALNLICFAFLWLALSQRNWKHQGYPRWVKRRRGWDA